MSQKPTPNWEAFLRIFLRQAGVKTPRSFWDVLHLIQHSLPTDTPSANQEKSLWKMTGPQFESFLAWFFERQGYHVTRTKKSNDHGADLILRKPGEHIVVQAKRRHQTIGVHAVQEVYAASAYYQAHRALVITTSKFSRSAVDLAHHLGVELWDWERLLQELRTFQQPPGFRINLPTNYNKNFIASPKQQQ